MDVPQAGFAIYEPGPHDKMQGSCVYDSVVPPEVQLTIAHKASAGGRRSSGARRPMSERALRAVPRQVQVVGHSSSLVVVLGRAESLRTSLSSKVSPCQNC